MNDVHANVFLCWLVHLGYEGFFVAWGNSRKITLALSTGSTDDITFWVQQAPSLFSPDSGDSGWCWPIFSVITANMHFVLVEARRKTDTVSPDVVTSSLTFIGSIWEASFSSEKEAENLKIDSLCVCIIALCKSTGHVAGVGVNKWSVEAIREKREKKVISAVKVWELTASSCIFNLRTRSESQDRYFSLCSSPEAAGEANSYKKHLLEACFVALWDTEQSLFAGLEQVQRQLCVCVRTCPSDWRQSDEETEKWKCCQFTFAFIPFCSSINTS